MARLNLSDLVSVEIADGATWRPREQVDGVLLDAPCSATGTLRRHPDIMYLKDANDVARLTVVQEGLLNNAAAMLKDDGLLVYCTCSLQKEEGEQQVNNFFRAQPEFRLRPIKPAEVGAPEEFVNAIGQLRLRPDYWPDKGGIDGFFVACLARP
jgi:16S rRNA (cytosine967-C5)-methyltransferase